MPLFLLELHQGVLDVPPVFKPVPPTEGWRFFAKCGGDDPLSCGFLYSDPAGFSSRRVQSDFLSFLRFLFEAGKAGISWAQLFRDGKLFHPVHSVDVERRRQDGTVVTRTIEVLQFKKKRTDVRILTLQTGIGSCNVYFLNAFEKDSAKTPPREQAKAEALVKEFFQALDAGAIQMVSAQGGQNATRLFV